MRRNCGEPAASCGALASSWKLSLNWPQNCGATGNNALMTVVGRSSCRVVGGSRCGPPSERDERDGWQAAARTGRAQGAPLSRGALARIGDVARKGPWAASGERGERRAAYFGRLPFWQGISSRADNVYHCRRTPPIAGWASWQGVRLALRYNWTGVARQGHLKVAALCGRLTLGLHLRSQDTETARNQSRSRAVKGQSIRKAVSPSSGTAGQEPRRSARRSAPRPSAGCPRRTTGSDRCRWSSPAGCGR